MTRSAEVPRAPALALVEVAAIARADARARWVAAILAAHAAGHSMRAIAEVAGVSHQEVWRVVNE